ncbi:MAG: hypothetical protein GY716_09185 [bacterium]|nr:hypothetical protein [bacterium]
MRLVRFGILLVVTLMSGIGIHAQTRIFYTSDEGANRDVWHTTNVGTTEVLYLDEAEGIHAPSFCSDRSTMFFDLGDMQGIGQENGGDLYVKQTGSSPTLVLDCGDTTGNVCLDVDCGPRVPGTSNRRIVYTQVSDSGAVSNIYVATWNGRGLENIIPVTTNVTAADNKNEQPAWCGNDHVVWSQYTCDGGFNQGASCPEGGVNEFTICKQQIGPSGLVGPRVCHDTPDHDDPPPLGDGGDEFSERHPDCGFNGEWKIAYAKTKDGPYGVSKICVLPRDDFAAEPICSPNEGQIDYKMPSWSPNATWLAVASDFNGTYDIFKVRLNLLPGGFFQQVGDPQLDDSDELDPEWYP